MLDNLAQLHTAIVHGLQAKLGVQTVDAYPVIRRRIVLPAVLVELSEMGPGRDPGTGETALVATFQARAIVDPNLPDADVQVRELAAHIAVAITHETWGLDVSIAQLVHMGEDAFKPELDSYMSWVVEWTHEFHLGESAWPYPDDTALTIMLGMYPETGATHEDDYWALGSAPADDWGES